MLKISLHKFFVAANLEEMCPLQNDRPLLETNVHIWKWSIIFSNKCACLKMIDHFQEVQSIEKVNFPKWTLVLNETGCMEAVQLEILPVERKVFYFGVYNFKKVEMVEILLRKIVLAPNFVHRIISVQPKYGMYGGYYKNIADLHRDMLGMAKGTEMHGTACLYNFVHCVLMRCCRRKGKKWNRLLVRSGWIAFSHTLHAVQTLQRWASEWDKQHQRFNERWLHRVFKCSDRKHRFAFSSF